MNVSQLYMVTLEILAISLIMVIFTYYRSRHEIAEPGRFRWKNALMNIILLSVIGLVCTTYITVKVDGMLVTPRDFIILFSTLIYGPAVGLPVSIVLGAGRFAMGGIAAISCGISCTTSLILGALLWYINRGKVPDMVSSSAIMFLSKCISLGLISLCTPGGNPVTPELLVLATLASVVAMIITMYHYRRFVAKGVA